MALQPNSHKCKEEYSEVTDNDILDDAMEEVPAESEQDHENKETGLSLDKWKRSHYKNCLQVQPSSSWELASLIHPKAWLMPITYCACIKKAQIEKKTYCQFCMANTKTERGLLSLKLIMDQIGIFILFQTTYICDCMFLSCHVRISEWIHTL